MAHCIRLPRSRNSYATVGKYGGDEQVRASACTWKSARVS